MFTIYDQIWATQAAWKVPFEGDSHNLLRRTVARLNTKREDTAYANFIPMVQSSGTGKSRLVDEVAKKVFTIPFNLREDYNGFPPSDEVICTFFKVSRIDGKLETFDDALLRFSHFFRVLFDSVRDFVEHAGPVESPDALASQWREKLLGGKFRSTFYESVMRKTYLNAKDLGESDQNVLVHLSAAIDAGKKLVEAIIRASGQCEGRLGNEEGIFDAPLIIYFDESQGLTTATFEESGRTIYMALYSTLNILREVDLFAIFLSTNSSLAHSHCVHAPFVETPFDIWMGPFLLKESTHTLDDIVEPGFMVRFGRPLFWTRYYNGSSVVRQHIFKFAQMKLMAYAPQQFDSDGILAALGVRLLLEFEPSRLAAILAESRLVEGHLRIAYSVPVHGEYMCSGTPSEPIIAEAAAQVLCGFNITGQVKMYVRMGFIGKGERGELVARLLLTLAHDAAVNSLQRSSPNFSTPIRLVDFLRSLFSKDAINGILNATPDNEHDGPPLQEAFKDAVVHFTHFAKAADDSVISDNQAWVALCRGIAWQCHEHHPSIDILIPVLLRRNDFLCRWTVSCIAISVKDRRDAICAEKMNIDLEKLGFYSAKKSVNSQYPSQRPYIAFTMQLGASQQESSSTSSTTKAMSSSSSVEVTEIGGPKTHGRKDVEHPRYSFTVSGCDPHVYGVVQDKDEFAELLSSRSLLDEHPYQDPDNIEALGRLKPFWKAGPGSYHGIKRDEAVASDSIVPSSSELTGVYHV